MKRSSRKPRRGLRTRRHFKIILRHLCQPIHATRMLQEHSPKYQRKIKHRTHEKVHAPPACQLLECELTLNSHGRSLASRLSHERSAAPQATQETADSSEKSRSVKTRHRPARCPVRGAFYNNSTVRCYSRQITDSVLHSLLLRDVL